MNLQERCVQEDYRFPNTMMKLYSPSLLSLIALLVLILSHTQSNTIFKKMGMHLFVYGTSTPCSVNNIYIVFYMLDIGLKLEIIKVLHTYFYYLNEM